jgi:hypothetical protein
MANQYVNKIVIGNETKLDLTNDDIKPEHLQAGIKAHDKSGAPIVGTNTNDADTSDGTAEAAEILKDKIAYVGGSKRVGTMPNNGAAILEIEDLDSEPAIPMGFHDGSGKAKISDAERAKIIPGNIREGVTILGRTGTMSGSEGMKPQAKTVTPTFSAQEILPDEDYNCLSSVTVNAIPVTYTDNAAGGQTITIG